MDKIEREAHIQNLYDLCKNDAEIARELNCCTETVRQWRIKNNKSKNFKYSDRHKVDAGKLLELVKEGFTDAEIAIKMDRSKDTVYAARKRSGINRRSYSENIAVIPTQNQLEILIGTLLGDSSLRTTGKNITFSCEHGAQQKEYCYSKYTELQSLGMRFYFAERKTPDKRNGIYYQSYVIRSKANPALNYLYDAFYTDNGKVIPMHLLDNFTAQSLAYMFMDDGYKSSTSISLATNCFSIENLKEFIIFLENKFKLRFNIQNGNRLYLHTEDLKLFISLIFPYLHESMYYKIGLQKVS